MNKHLSQNPQNPAMAPNQVSLWLFFCAGMVFAMIVIGAITRLTESGLSMVEWKPLIGFVPPLNEAEWNRIFGLYQNTPEFQKKNFWMELGDFKTIFFWEWFHRLFGRLIGLIYALPLLWFWIRGQIQKPYRLPLIGILILGGLQGAMGWYMVKSGLIDEPSVSHYRLAAHLSLAFLLLSLLLWFGLSIRSAPKPIITPAARKKLYQHTWIALLIFAFTMIWGAYTAGLDAGLVYNETFPKMGAHWLPDDINRYNPFWINFFETHGGVQFAHRWLAILMLLTILSLWARAYRLHATFPALHGLAVMIIIQATLGISTLLSKVWIPLAVLHQAGAVIVCMLLVLCLHTLRKPE